MRHRDSGAFRPLARGSYLYNWLWLLSERAEAPPGDVDPLILKPLRRMHAAARERNARLGVMCFPGYGSRTAEHLDPARDRCRFHGVAEWAAEAGVPYLDLVGAEASYRISDISLDNIHRSPYGHEVDAVAIFDWLVDDHVVPYRAIHSRPKPPPL